MTFLLVPGRDEPKTNNLLVDTADAAIYSGVFFVCLLACLRVFASRGVSNMSSIPHVSSIQ